MKPLWEHQTRDIQTMMASPETFNMSDPGTGKTRVVIEAIRQLGLPTLILAPKSILQCAWGNDIEEFAPELTYTVATATNRSKAFGTDSQIIITNHDAVTWLVQPANEKHLARFKGGMFVVDECFPKGTKVETINGLQAIETVIVGTPILTSNGFIPVSKLYANTTKQLTRLYLSDGTHIDCTSNHPFATDKGWCSARDTLGLSLVRNELYISPTPATILQQNMQQKSNVGEENTSRTYPNITESILKTKRSPCLEYRDTLQRRDETKAKGRTQNFRTPTESKRGEWANKLPRNTYARNIIHGMAISAHHLYQNAKRLWLSHVLQSRLRSTRKEMGARDRRKLTHIAQVVGREERFFSSSVRVERVATIELGSPISVYNLETDGVNDYFANGLLVHNCTAYKNPTAKRSKAAAAIRESFSHATLMSGTPTPQGIIDLWHQMYLVDRGKLLGNSFYRFRSTTHTPVNKGAFTEWVEKEGVADAIADIISGVTIRNAREDCMDLPENLVVHRRYQLSAPHLKVYNELKRHAFIELESGDVNAVNAAVLLSKLLQVASGAVYDEYGEAHLIDTQRYELVMDLVDERDHSVVFFNFKHQKNELIKLAEKAKMKYAVIDGSVSGAKRTQAVEDFQAGKLKVLFCHPQSAGHGITLTKGTATIWVSPTYNVEHFEQANARIFRGGQTKKTETILISAEGTVDARAYKALFDKQLDMNNLLEVLR